MIKRIILSLFATFLLFPLSAEAQMKTREFGGIIYVDKTTVKEIEELFGKHNYLRFNNLNDNAYPAIFLSHLPTDFNQISSQKYRNELFIRILAPLALKINEEIANERQTLLRFERKWQNEKHLSEHDIKKLEEFAVKYDYFTRLKGDSRISIQIKNLKSRIDIIPPSILVAAAAMNTNWGNSRLVKEANSLYKEKIWYTTEGLEPLENKDDGYRFKIFNSLLESMRSFALTFNSNINYENVRFSRIGMVKRHGTIFGESIAYTLSTSNNLPNFAGILDYTTAYYDLRTLDLGHLKKGLSL